MATNIAVLTAWSNQYKHELFVHLVSQDVVANTSTIHWDYLITNTGSLANGSWSFVGDVAFYGYIQGVANGGARTFDFREYNFFLAQAGDATIAHNTDGTKSFSIGLHGDANPGSIAFGAVDASGTATLPAIPRASSFTVTPNPVIEGGTVGITLTRANAGFTHDITWVSGADSGTIATGVGTSTTWTPSSSLLALVNKRTISIIVQTKSGATNIGGPVSRDLIFKKAPVYPEVGQNTPYDLRLRRVVVEGGKLTPKENIPFLKATTTDTLSASASLTLETASGIYDTDLDEAVVVVDVYDGSQWLTGDNLLFVMSRTEDDKADISSVRSYTGLAYVDFILSKSRVAGESKEWVDAAPGGIVRTYVNESKDRGWGTFLAADFDGSRTSAGTAWQNTDTISTTQDMPISQILDGMVTDALAEYKSHLNVSTGQAIFEMYNPGYGEDWTVAGADPIVNLSLAAMFKAVDSAPVRKDASNKITRVTVRGEEGGVTREDSSVVNPIFGHLEGIATASGVKDNNRLNELADAILSQNKTATVERTFSYDLSSNETPTQLFPYRTFRPGDWILIPGDEGPIRARVAQVGITRDEDGTTATITTGDLIPSGLAATARKISQSNGGAIAGGTLQNPSQLSSAIPAAPMGVTALTNGYWDETGAAKSGVDITWGAVTRSLSNTPLVIDVYEVWTRPEPGSPWELASISDDAETTVAPLDVDQSLELKVRGRSQAGVYGTFSDVTSVVTAAPSVDLDGPVMTDLYTDGVGSIYAVWAGILGSDPAPLRLAYVGAEVSTDGGVTYVPAGTPIVGAGTIVIGTNGVWGEYMVRLRGYDRLGNAGDASAPQTITITDPHINPSTPLAPVNLVAVPGAGWDASGFFPVAWFDLSWDAVVEDTDGNPIIILGYDIWGKLSTEDELRYITSSTSNTVRVPAITGESWSFQIKAASQYGTVSTFSDVVLAIADATVAAAPAPDAPTLSQYAGILRIQWSGNGMLPQIKFVYATISTSASGPFTRAGMPLMGAGEVPVPGLATGTNYYARIVMVDELGTTSTSAVAGPIFLDPITGVTIQTSPIANTGIKMTSGSLTSYDVAGNPTFILDAATGEVWIAPYDAVFELGASGTTAETGTPVTGIAISSENSSFNTFIHPSGVQIRNDQTPLSWWEADADDASLVNFFSPREVISQRLRVGDYEMLKEAKPVGSRLVIRYKGA